MTHFAGRAGKVLFLSVLTAMLLAATALAADIATGAGCTTGSSLRLRAEPSTSASVVTTLDKSVAVAILDDSVDGWYKIAYNGSTGYVSADYLNVDQDNVFTTYGRVNSDGVNVRSDASTDSSVLATIEEDAIVTVNGLVDGWYDVTCEYGTTLQIADGVKIRFTDAGHLLGSASVEMWLTEGGETRKVVFSGRCSAAAPQARQMPAAMSAVSTRA